MKRLILLGIVALLVVVFVIPAPNAMAKKYKIALSMSYIGNDWQGVTGTFSWRWPNCITRTK